MKTKVEHIICKLHWCGKTDFIKNRKNTLEFMGAPGSSCAFMGAHLCSPVFMCFCLVVWLFPTCQVRVVRFYQSCSRLASPPPPRPPSPPPLLLASSSSTSASSLPTLRQALRQALRQRPSSVCTAGPQPVTFPAQCAPLDNLGPAQLSVHRWTSTCGPAQLSVHRWTSTCNLSRYARRYAGWSARRYARRYAR